MNAFAVGNRADSAIAVTDGLLRGLSLRQLTGVLAHEVSHIRSGDLKVMALADVLSRLTSTMAMVGTFVFFASLPVMLATGTDVPWSGIALLLLAPTLSGLLQLGLSPAREYDADFDAMALTGDPEGLASALETLERRQGRLWEGLPFRERVCRIRRCCAPIPPPPIALRGSGASTKAPARRPCGETVPVRGRTSIPPISPPRVHWLSLGVWY